MSIIKIANDVEAIEQQVALEEANQGPNRGAWTATGAGLGAGAGALGGAAAGAGLGAGSALLGKGLGKAVTKAGRNPGKMLGGLATTEGAAGKWAKRGAIGGGLGGAAAGGLGGAALGYGGSYVPQAADYVVNEGPALAQQGVDATIDGVNYVKGRLN